jgi:hypothetical protein
VRRKAAKAAAAAADDSDYEDELEARHHHHQGHHRNHSPPSRGAAAAPHEQQLNPHQHSYMEAMGLQPGHLPLMQLPGLMMPPRYGGPPAAKRRALAPPAITMPGEGDAVAPGQDSLSAISLPYMATPGSTTLDLLNSAMRMPAPLDVFGPGTLEGPPQLLTTTPGAAGGSGCRAPAHAHRHAHAHTLTHSPPLPPSPRRQRLGPGQPLPAHSQGHVAAHGRAGAAARAHAQRRALLGPEEPARLRGPWASGQRRPNSCAALASLVRLAVAVAGRMGRGTGAAPGKCERLQRTPLCMLYLARLGWRMRPCACGRSCAAPVR